MRRGRAAAVLATHSPGPLTRQDGQLLLRPCNPPPPHPPRVQRGNATLSAWPSTAAGFGPLLPVKGVQGG